MSGTTIELLHLSDLHFGPHSRFADADPADLGRSFARNLLQERERLKLPRLDVVIVTGDLAEAGKPKEFNTAADFLGTLAGELGIERREFVFVPGNHDVSWRRCKDIQNELEEEDAFTEEEFQKRIAEAKLDRYLVFLKDFYRADPGEVATPLSRGAYLYKYSSLPLAVAALNSCEAESHRSKDHKGLVSEEQAQVVMNALRAPDVAGWIKVIAVHHNPVVTVPANIADWRKWLKEAGSLDDELLARYESDI
ncbi:MAG: metallophosphoesterase family protein, partial [Thermoanaerobaculia bacterium]